MRRLVYALTFAFVLVLAGSTVLADPAEPSGGGTVPDGEHQVWLPVVRHDSRCGVFVGEYYAWKAYPGPYEPPGSPSYGHNIRYGTTATAEQLTLFFNEESARIVVALDPQFREVIVKGGRINDHWPYISWFILTLRGYDALEIGQTYFARLEYTCDGIKQDTPALVFVAEAPED